MIRSLPTALLSMSVLLLLDGSASGQSLDQERAAVVKVTSVVEGERKTGTGFIVRLEADTAYILTASHVVEGDNRPHVEFFVRQNVPVEAETARIEGGDPRGLALLLVRGKQRLVPGLSALPLAKGTNLTGGEQVTAIGFPQGGGPWAVARADVVSRLGRDLTLAGPINEGNSGGPVLLNGAVVAVVTGVNANFALATPVAIASLTLEGWGVTPASTPTATAEPAPERPAAFRVASLVARAPEPAEYKGACPAKIGFSWRVAAANVPGTLSYRVIRSDGLTGPTERRSIDRPGAIDIPASWTLGRADASRRYDGWVALQLLEPQEMESDKVHFTVDCVPAAAAGPPQGGAVKILFASCENLRSGTSFRVTVRGEAQGPTDATLRVALALNGAVKSTPKASCSEWDACRRQPSAPEKTRWQMSTIVLRPVPDTAIISLEPNGAGAAAQPFTSERVALDCRN